MGGLKQEVVDQILSPELILFRSNPAAKEGIFQFWIDGSKIGCPLASVGGEFCALLHPLYPAGFSTMVTDSSTPLCALQPTHSVWSLSFSPSELSSIMQDTQPMHRLEGLGSDTSVRGGQQTVDKYPVVSFRGTLQDTC